MCLSLPPSLSLWKFIRCDQTRDPIDESAKTHIFPETLWCWPHSDLTNMQNMFFPPLLFTQQKLLNTQTLEIVLKYQERQRRHKFPSHNSQKSFSQYLHFNCLLTLAHTHTKSEGFTLSWLFVYKCPSAHRHPRKCPFTFHMCMRNFSQQNKHKNAEGGERFSEMFVQKARDSQGKLKTWNKPPEYQREREIINVLLQHFNEKLCDTTTCHKFFRNSIVLHSNRHFWTFTIFSYENGTDNKVDF